MYSCWRREEGVGSCCLCISGGWSVGLAVGEKAGSEAGRAETNWSLKRKTRTHKGKTDPWGPSGAARIPHHLRASSVGDL